MKKIEIIVPTMGESITEATVAKWFKKEGELVKKDEILLELETDKVTQEIYSSDNGIISALMYDEGDDVKIGDTLATIDPLVEANEKSNRKEKSVLTNKSDSNDAIFSITVPSLGESITEATIGKWIKKVGEEVKKGEPLVEIETDKVTQELYAEYNGVITEVYFDEQEEVKIGEVIANLRAAEISNQNIKAEKNIVDKQLIKEPETQLDPTTVKRSGLGNKISLIDLQEFSEEISFTPSAKRIIKEKELDTSTLKPTPGSNRVNKSDLIEVAESTFSESIQKNKSSSIKTDIEKPLSNLRKSIASRLKLAQNTAAMLTTFNEIDMSNIINIRKKYKDKFFDKHHVKLGFMSFFTKAVITVLKEIPEINAEIKGDSIIYKNRYDIGIAVGTDKGLFVPVIRNADRMSFSKIENEIINYGKLAKENKLNVDHMKDGTFTISNGGVYGSMLSTPILNTPQSGILGLHNIVKRPWVINEKVEIRPIMYVALTYDHRIVDGREAVTFLVRVKEIIENPEQLIFE